jgi:hypothetical protein
LMAEGSAGMGQRDVNGRWLGRTRRRDSFTIGGGYV